MKYLVVGDSHFSKHNEEETDLLQREVDRVIQEEEPDEVILLGDTSDRHDLRPLCRAKEWIVALSSRLPVTVLVGNHEREDNMDYHSKVHHFVGMDREGLRIVDKSIRVGDILFVPYVRPGMFHTSLTSAGSLKGVKWIFAHQSFVGCGDPNAKDEWKGQTRVISGHIHNRHSLHRGQAVVPLSTGWDVYYPGSSTCTTFLDRDDRYLCVVDGEDVREVKIASYKRSTIDLTPDFDDSTISLIASADKYTQINVIGTLPEYSLLRDAEFVRDAEKRGAKIKSVILPDDAVVQEVRDVSVPFVDSILGRLKVKWEVDDLNYLSRVMGR